MPQDRQEPGHDGQDRYAHLLRGKEFAFGSKVLHTLADLNIYAFTYPHSEVTKDTYEKRLVCFVVNPAGTIEKSELTDNGRRMGFETETLEEYMARTHYEEFARQTMGKLAEAIPDAQINTIGMNDDREFDLGSLEVITRDQPGGVILRRHRDVVQIICLPNRERHDYLARQIQKALDQKNPSLVSDLLVEATYYDRSKLYNDARRANGVTDKDDE